MPLRPNPLSGVNENQDSLFLTARARPVTDDTHLNAGDQVVLVNAIARAITVVLPRAATVRFRGFIIVKIDAADHRVTISGGGTSLVNGALNVTINGQYNGVWVWSDGTQYFTLPGGGA